MKTKWIVWGLVGLALALGAYFGLRPAAYPKGVVNVDAAKVQSLLADSRVRVVDVRTATEFEAGHLARAENVPVDQVASLVASWDRSQPLLLYCATGARSAQASAQLKGMGFHTIYDFSVGLIAWQGKLETGAVAQGPKVQTNGIPVMYELYTDT